MRSLPLGSRFPNSYVVLFTLEQIIGKYFSIGFHSLCFAELRYGSISYEIKIFFDAKNQTNFNGE